ncbi:DUF4136 domain-containing protein [Polluticoccus soli]|uniref:DUF4136 domain-containing protein n=1 Tax=Polluticoccus soli TaxID=3034150 RepID=UPI0023E2F56F|nr:DUF4136 domain-containing protein [Flavipsychrobacter sp. JY13-12]
MKQALKGYIALSLLCMQLASCSSSLDVISDYDKGANFSNYRTYGIDEFSTPEELSTENKERILTAVRSEMLKKGFTESTLPDMLVHVSAIFHYEESVPTSRDYYSYGGVFRPYVWGNGAGVTAYTTYDVKNYIDGSLIIDIGDAETQRLLWEGIGNKEIYREMVDPVSEIPEAVKKIMASFPPDR